MRLFHNTTTYLFTVEDLFHFCPPLALWAIGQRELAWFAQFPPFLRGLIGCHPGHIRIVIFTCVLEITKQLKLTDCWNYDY